MSFHWFWTLPHVPELYIPTASSRYRTAWAAKARRGCTCPRRYNPPNEKSTVTQRYFHELAVQRVSWPWARGRQRWPAGLQHGNRGDSAWAQSAWDKFKERETKDDRPQRERDEEEAPVHWAETLVAPDTIEWTPVGNKQNHVNTADKHIGLT